MKIGVIGLGRIGLVSALGLLELGHDVIGYDCDSEKIEKVRSLSPPFFEPEIEGYLKKYRDPLQKFTSRESEFFSYSFDQIWICVSTPTHNSNQDLSQVESVLKTLTQFLSIRPNDVSVILRSTVLPGTCQNIQDRLPFPLIYHPEFLSEGEAFNGFLKPSRIVFGVGSHTSQSDYNYFKNASADFSLIPKTVVTDFVTAELAKYSANLMLASRLAVINELSQIAKTANADMSCIEEIVGSDERIGSRYLTPGFGLGGPCLLKDADALHRWASSHAQVPLISNILASDVSHRKFQSNNLIEFIKNNLDRCRLVIFYNLGYKLNTDDLTNSPLLDLLKAVRTHYPQLPIKYFDNSIRDSAKADALKAELGAEIIFDLTQLNVPTIAVFNHGMNSQQKRKIKEEWGPRISEVLFYN